MKIKVKKAIQKTLAVMLCMIMLLGVAPLTGVDNLLTSVNAEESYRITCYYFTTVDGVSQEATWTQTYAEGDTVTIPSEVKSPSRIGYKFDKWSIDIPSTMPAHDISTTAQWIINKYTITFQDTGDKKIDPITQDYGSTIKKPENPTREGYTFMGWDKEIPSVMPVDGMTITALWEINPYTISFDSDGGTDVAPITKDYGNVIVPPEAPTREGYAFMGWEPELPPTMPAESMLVKAKWEIKQYTISFANTGETTIDPITQDYGTAVVRPQNPVKEGYTFNGWDKEIPTIMPAENITVTAKWAANKINISYNPNGGYIVDPETNQVKESAVTVASTFGQGFTLPADPTRSGYTFLGWVDANGQPKPAKVPSEPTTYYASWSEGTGGCYYRVTVSVMDETGKYGTGTSTLYAASAGDTVSANYKPETGFKISADSVLSGTVSSANTSTSPLELSVKVEREKYTVSFNSNGGSEVSQITSYYGAVITVPEAPEKTGYTFDGWKNDATGKPDTIPTIMPAANTSFTAQWLANSDTPYKVVICYNDVTNGNIPETKEVYYGRGVTGSKIKIYLDGGAGTDSNTVYHALSSFTLEHYTFDTSAMSKQQLEGTIAADGSTVLNLYFVPTKYNVTFSVAGYTIETKQVEYYTHASNVTPTEAKMAEVFAEKMPGYSFIGWNPDLKTVTGDIEYVAKYDSNPYVVRFNYIKVIEKDGVVSSTVLKPDEGEELAPITQDFNTDVTIPDYPVKSGYTCKGWFDSNDKEYTPGQVIKMPADGLILTAKYTAKIYSVVFDSNLDGATNVRYMTAACDDEFVLPAYPTKEGCTCVGWYEKDGLTKHEAGDKMIMPVGGLVLTAQWNINKFMVMFEDDKDISSYNYIDVACGSIINAPAYPTAADMNNRTFMGWRESNQTTGYFEFGEMPGRSIVLKAIWGYSINFNTDGGTLAVAKASAEMGTEIDLAKYVPVKTGYTFTGWYATEEDALNGENKVEGKVSYTEDTALYAGWSVNSYTLSFNSNGGSSVPAITQDYGTAVKAPATPTKTGYSFVGWALSADATETVELPKTMPAEDVTYYAIWVINKYTITFVDSDNTVIYSFTQDYNTEFKAPENPSKIGYKFNGWDKKVPETIPAENLVIKAKWTAITYTITFVDTDGKVIDVVSGYYGSKVEEIKEPTKWFYTFTGWDQPVPETMPAENLVITATWEKNPSFFDSFISAFLTFIEMIISFFKGFADI